MDLHDVPSARWESRATLDASGGGRHRDTDESCRESFLSPEEVAATHNAACLGEKPPRWLVDHMFLHGEAQMEATFALVSNHDQVLNRFQFYEFLRTYAANSSPLTFTDAKLRRMYDDVSEKQTRRLSFRVLVQWLKEAQLHGFSYLEEEETKRLKETTRSQPSRRRARELMGNKADQYFHFSRLPPLSI